MKTEPKSGFRIAFNMFDTDGNAVVDKEEFMVVSRFHPVTLFYHNICSSIANSFFTSTHA